ncbi:MAG: hypothetical protein PHT34_03835 [Oscillospiraceae bacterium]|nr:hypothetical protein [Oscillospiraceae bacterium]
MRNEQADKKRNGERIGVKKCILYFLFSGLIILGLYARFIMIAAAAIIVLYIFAASVQGAFEITLFLVPFINIFKISPSSMSLFTFICLSLILKLLWNGKAKCLRGMTLLPFLILLIYAVFSIFSSFNSTLNFIFGITFLLLVFGTSCGSELDARKIVIYFAYGILVASVWGLLKTYIAPINEFLRVYYYRLSSQEVAYRFSGLCENSNYYTIDVSIALAALLTLFMRKRIEKSLFFFGVPLIAFGLMSQSKSFFLVAVLLLVSFGTYLVRQRGGSLTKFLLIAAVLAAAAYRPITYFTDTYLARIFNAAHTSSSMGDLTTGRWEIWSVYMSHIFSNAKTLFVGTGLGKQLHLGPSHNLFVQLLYNFGLLGSAVYFWYVRSLIGRKQEWKTCIPLILVFILRAFTANILFYDNLYFYLFLILLLINNPKRVQDCEELKD